MNFYSKTMSERYIHFPSKVDMMGRNANGKRVREPGSTSEERAYKHSLCRTVNTSEYSIDVLTGKMSRLTIEDKKEPEEVIVWKGNYIVCDWIKDWNKVSGEKREAKKTHKNETERVPK